MVYVILVRHLASLRYNLGKHFLSVVSLYLGDESAVPSVIVNTDI